MLGGGGEAAGLSTRKSKGTKYRGVKQQREGKWRAEIRKPQSRWRAYIGTYDSPETAAYAYDRAAYRLLGEHARPNFPGIMNRPGDDGFPEALRHLRDAVDAKFQDDGVIVPGRRTQAKEGHLHESKHARAGERRESAQAASPAPARPVLSGNDATSAETTTTSLYGPFEVLFSVDDSERLLEELMASADMELELMPSADVELEPIPSADVTSAETTTTSLYGPFEVPFSVDDVERLLEELMPSADVELEPIPSADVDLKAMPFDDMVLMWELMD